MSKVFQYFVETKKKVNHSSMSTPNERSCRIFLEILLTFLVSLSVTPLFFFGGGGGIEVFLWRAKFFVMWPINRPSISRAEKNQIFSRSFTLDYTPYTLKQLSPLDFLHGGWFPTPQRNPSHLEFRLLICLN